MSKEETLSFVETRAEISKTVKGSFNGEPENCKMQYGSCLMIERIKCRSSL
jgi:hypothetical protein